MFPSKNLLLSGLIISLFCIGIIACERKTNPIVEQDIQATNGVDSIKILTLGDSYTIGQSVSEIERWPNQLRDSLEHYGITVPEVRIIARTGWTTGNLLTEINNQNFEYSYDLVGLLIGVNNQFQGKSISEYENQFRQLLETAITLADSNTHCVFVLSIPDYTVTPVGSQYGDSTTTQEIDAFNAINLQISKQFKVPYFDITPISRTALGREDLVASDGLHFSGKMYALWVEYILTDILDLLN